MTGALLAHHVDPDEIEINPLRLNGSGFALATVVRTREAGDGQPRH